MTKIETVCANKAFHKMEYFIEKGIHLTVSNIEQKELIDSYLRNNDQLTVKSEYNGTSQDFGQTFETILADPEIIAAGIQDVLKKTLAHLDTNFKQLHLSKCAGIILQYETQFVFIENHTITEKDCEKKKTKYFLKFILIERFDKNATPRKQLTSFLNTSTFFKGIGVVAALAGITWLCAKNKTCISRYLRF